MKRISILLLVLIVTFTSAVCMANGRKKLGFWGAKTSYDEWVQAIGLFNGKKLKIDTYAEREDGLIEIVFYSEDEDELGYKELSELIDRHNKFVEDNPSYFNPGTYIWLRDYEGGTGRGVYFFSREDVSTYGLQVNGLDDTKDDMKIKYAAINMKDEYGYRKIADNNVIYDIPVVLLWYYQGACHSENCYEVLNHFAGIEKVLLEYKDDDAGFEESKEKVLHFAPDVEVYKRASDGQWTLMD